MQLYIIHNFTQSAEAHIIISVPGRVDQAHAMPVLQIEVKPDISCLVMQSCTG
jgi:hypothetical protein